MHDVPLPEGEAPAPVRAMVACLAAAGEVPVDELLREVADLGPAADLVGAAPDPGRAENLGSEAQVTLMFGTPPGVVLSPQDADLLGGAAADLPVRDGFVLASVDPVLGRAGRQGRGERAAT